jgi:cohesin loading factor subunit SCC2
MTSTKTGDQPYRNLLDLFTEDLISVLGSSDWPGAELILTMLASQMIGIMEHDKSLANAKNMALELLGWMGSAISELISTARHLCNAIDDSDAELTHSLRQMFEDHTNRTLHVEDLIVLNGPYRVVLEYLEERNVGRSQLSAARGYLLAQWGKTVCTVYQASKGAEATAGDAAVQSLAESMNDILSNPRWLEVNR